MKSRLLALALCSALTTPALADSGYFGLDAGTTSLSNASYSFTSGFTTYDFTFPNPGNVRFSFGGQLSDQFALEMGYTIFGNSVVDFGGGSKLTLSATSFQFAGIGSLPVDERISAYVKLGQAKNEADLKSEGPLFTGRTVSVSTTDLIYGIGLQYKVNDRLSARGEYADYGGLGDLGFNLLGATSFSIGILSKF